MVSAGLLKYPLDKKELRAVLKSMAELALRPQPIDKLAGLRLGLVVQTLFSAQSRAGVSVTWRAGVTVEELAEKIETARDDLGVKPGRVKAKKPITPAKVKPTNQ